MGDTRRNGWSVRLYRAALRLYPGSYRRDWAERMEETFRERQGERSSSGASSRLRFLSRELGSVVLAALRERRSAARKGGTRLRPRAAGPIPPRPPSRPSRWRRAVHDALADLRVAARGWWAEPTLTAVIVVTVALGIGATTAIFSVVDAVLLEPLDLRDAERIVRVHEVPPDGGTWTLSAPDFVDLRSRTRTLETVSVLRSTSLTLTGDGLPEQLDGALVSPGFFDLIGVEIAHGRGFTADEARPDAAPTVVLGHALWRDRLGGDPDVLGSRLRIDGREHTVVGILDSDPMLDDEGVDLWLPFRLTEQELLNRGGHMYPVVGRLAPGSSVVEATAEVSAIFERIASEHPESHEGRSGTVRPLRAEIVGGAATVLWLILGAVTMVLLIACVNVTNLMLARAEGRLPELGVRSALGAGRARLVRQMLAESLLVTSLGGALGLLVAHFGVTTIAAGVGSSLPRAGEIGTDPRVLAFALLLTMVTGVGVGLVPALRVTSGDLRAAIGSGAGREAGAGGSLLARRGLVVVEIALAVVLVTGAGLLLQSMWRLQRVETGFEASNALTFRIRLPAARYDDADTAGRFFRRLEDELEALPGVEAVGASGLLPFFSSQTTGLHAAGRPEGRLERVEFRQVTPGFFEAIGARLVRGRPFDGRDTGTGRPVMILNETLARRLFPDSDPLGEAVVTGWGSHPDAIEIVGVVEDMRIRSLDRPAPPTMFWPVGQYSWRPSASYVLRTTAAAETLVPLVRDVVARLDPELAVHSIETLATRVRRSIDTERLLTTLLSGFAALALVLGAVGVFGVISYSVGRRRKEVGLRVALGASPRQVATRFLGEGLALASAGVLVGSATALLLGRFLASVLYEIRPGDPPTLAAVVTILLVVAAGSCVWPARRAARVDPMEVLRRQ